jgi:hypothetical protein
MVEVMDLENSLKTKGQSIFEGIKRLGISTKVVLLKIVLCDPLSNASRDLGEIDIHYPQMNEGLKV